MDEPASGVLGFDDAAAFGHAFLVVAPRGSEGRRRFRRIIRKGIR
jgi:hypothetical protein